MDERNRQLLTMLILVPALVLGAIFGTNYIAKKANKPAEGASAQQAEPQAPAEPTATPTKEPESRTLTKAEKRARLESQSTATIKTDDFIATFTDLNTALTSLVVTSKRYDVGDKHYELVTTDKEAYFPLGLKLGGIDIPPDAQWTIDAADNRIRFLWRGDGVQITRTWEVGSELYQLRSTVVIKNETITPRDVQLGITSAHYVPRAEEKAGFLFFTRPSPGVSHGLCKYADEFVREDREDLLTPQGYGPDVHFVGLTNVYFSTIMAPEGEPAQWCELKTSDRGGTAKEPDGSLFEARLDYPGKEVAPSESVSYVTAVYAGPKDVDALEAFGRGATKAIDLGWFGFIAQGMNWSLRTIYDWVGNWGLAIILLTLIVRLAILPLVTTQYRNMAKQRALKPEVDKINELYKDNREEKGQAMMELWRKHKVNPLGGCLPVLLQMPIFFALYQSLLTNIELYHAPFIWWWTDLSAPDPYYVLPVVLGLLMFLQQKLTPISIGDPTQAKIIMYVMPIGISLFMLLLPAGLGLYMMTSYTLGIAQQRYMYWRMDQQGDLLETASGADEPAEEASPAAVAKSSTRAKARRKKRPRRGRA